MPATIQSRHEDERAGAAASGFAAGAGCLACFLGCFLVLEGDLRRRVTVLPYSDFARGRKGKREDARKSAPASREAKQGVVPASKGGDTFPLAHAFERREPC